MIRTLIRCSDFVRSVKNVFNLAKKNDKKEVNKEQKRERKKKEKRKNERTKERK